MKKNLIFAGIITVLSVASSFFVAEIFLRVRHHRFVWKNFITEDWNFLSAGFPVEHDGDLGWVTRSNIQIEKDNYQKNVTLLENGIRSNGKTTDFTPDQTRKKILVVGASHAFGSQVSNEETWPAYLEGALHVPVLNAAVFGYGIDQMVMRYEKLVLDVKPAIGILAFHPENISYCEYSQKFAKKPFFELKDGQLVLKNTPVPPTRRELSPLQATLGYSYLAHTVGTRLAPHLWKNSRGDIQEHKNGEQVSCNLLKRFIAFNAEHSIRPIIVIQHWEDSSPEFAGRVERVLSCAGLSHSESVLDTRESLNRVALSDPELFHSFFNYHMTAAGNRFVAEQIKEVVQKTVK